MCTEKNKEGIHKDHLVYLVNSSPAQPTGRQLWQPLHSHSHQEPLTPSSKDKLKVLHRTAQFRNMAATTLQSALWLLCLVWEQGQGGTAALGTPVSPWCAVLRAPLHKPDWAQPQKCLWPELLHLQGLRSQLPSELFPLRHPSTSSRASWALLRSKPLALCRRHGGTA